MTRPILFPNGCRPAALLLLLAGLLAGCTAEPHAERIAAVESEIVPARIFGDETPASLEERMRQLNVPAVSIAVFVDGEIAWARAYGTADLESGRPATTETLFQAASISKPVAAAAMLDMVEDGLVDLDADVNDYLTSWRLPGNAFTETEKVTLRRIVNHTAGLTVWGFPGYARDEAVPSTVGVLDGAGNTDSIRVYKTPGESWQYSGGGYTVMQQLLVDVAGQPFPEIVRERVLDPAGMTSGGYLQPLPEDLHRRAATGYRAGGEEVEGKWHVYPEMAAAGLWTTPSDLARFAIAIQNDYRGAGTILEQETVREMLTPGEEDHGLGPGLSEDGLRFGHGGANEGFRCNLTAFLDGRGGVAVMTNSDAGGTLAYEVILTIARAYDWPGLEPERIEVAQLDPARYEALVGTYAFEPGDVDVAYEDGRLTATTWAGETVILVPTSPTEFVTRDDGDRITFEVQDGRVQRMVFNGQFGGERKPDESAQ